MNKPADSSTKYWFPAKKSGLGWGVPGAWQGWVTLGIATAIIVGSLLYFERPAENGEAAMVIVATVVALLIICIVKGEPLRRG